MVPVGRLNELVTCRDPPHLCPPVVAHHFSFYINKSTVIHSVVSLTPPQPFAFLSIKQGPPGGDAWVLKLWGVNRGSTCGEAERHHHSGINCTSRRGNREEDRNAVALTAAASSLKVGGRGVTGTPRVHLSCHLDCNCPLFCHSDYARQGHANEEQKIGCLKVKSRKHRVPGRRHHFHSKRHIRRRREEKLGVNGLKSRG